jgi:MYXO-CTERM domain-containing protein
MRRLWVVSLVGALLVAAAIWSGAEASAPGIVQLVYIGFLMLFGAALAAGVRKRGRRHELFNRVKREER